MTTTNTHKHIQHMIEFAGALVIAGMGLNVLVMQTLGSFDAAVVILGLFLGFWTFVLGNLVLIPSTIWLFIRKANSVAEPVPVKQTAAKQARLGWHALCH